LWLALVLASMIGPSAGEVLALPKFGRFPIKLLSLIYGFFMTLYVAFSELRFVVSREGIPVTE
jgi:hypothetical protein